MNGAQTAENKRGVNQSGGKILQQSLCRSQMVADGAAPLRAAVVVFVIGAYRENRRRKERAENEEHTNRQSDQFFDGLLLAWFRYTCPALHFRRFLQHEDEG